MNKDKKSSKIKYYVTIIVWFLVGLLISVFLGLAVTCLLLYIALPKIDTWGSMILGFFIGMWVTIYSDLVKKSLKK